MNTNTINLEENIMKLQSAIENIADAHAFQLLNNKLLETGTVY